MKNRLALASVSSLALGVALAGCASTPSDSTGSDRSRDLGVAIAPDMELAAYSLKPSDSCDELLDWYIEKNLPKISAWGWDEPMLMYQSDMIELDSGATKLTTEADEGTTNSETGTNTQEAGVDEPDSAKTNGDIVVRIGDRRSIVVTDVTGAEPEEIGRLQLTKGFSPSELLLVGDRVLVTGYAEMQPGSGAASSGSQGSTLLMPDDSHMNARRALLELDLSDPKNPELISTSLFHGDLESLRQYGDTVRAVITHGKPEFEFKQPRDKKMTNKEAKAYNKQLVESSTIDDWLPTMTRDGEEIKLATCDQVLHPAESSTSSSMTGSSMTVIGWDVAAPEDFEATTLTSTSDVFYSSRDHFYTVSSNYGWDVGPWMDDMASPRVAPGDSDSKTTVHQFDLDGISQTYVASGQIDGSIRDRWSLDEQDGMLRVARQLPGKKQKERQNGIVILKRDDSALVKVGEVNKLGVGEDIQSVRWLGDIAIVITFRRIDPVYTIDLSDPTAPKQLGELKIPGFSSYLHPVGGDIVLGAGIDASKRGRRTADQISSFDLSDLTKPTRVQATAVSKNSWLMVKDDPRAFSWLPDQRTAVTFADVRGGSSLVLIKVANDGSFKLTQQDLPGSWSWRALPLGDDAVALVSPRQVKIVELS